MDFSSGRPVSAPRKRYARQNSPLIIQRAFLVRNYISTEKLPQPKHVLVGELMRWARLLRNADSLLAKLCIPSAFLLIVISILLPSATYFFVGILVLISCLFWLHIRNRFIIERTINQWRPSFFLCLAAIFFFCFTYSLVILNTRSIVYERPIEFFVLLSIMSGILALEVSFLPGRKYSLLVLAQIIVLGLNLCISQMTLYPNVVGVDPWYHRSFTEAIVNLGSIPPDGSYSMLPMFHLNIAVPIQLLDIDYKLASILSVSMIQVMVDVFIIFCLGRHFFNEKVGLMAALLLTMSNFHINMSFWPVPNYFGFIIVVILIYLLVKFWKDTPPALFVLIILLMTVITMTHVFAMVFTAIVLLSWTIMSIIFSKRSNSHTPKYISRITVGFLVMAALWLTNATGYGQILIDYIQLGLSGNFFSRIPNPATELMSDYLRSTPLEQTLFSQLGIFICSVFALIGYLYMISGKRDDLGIYAYAITGMVIVIVPFVSTIIGLSILGERWFFFAQIIGAIPLTVALLSIIRPLKKESVQTIAIAIITTTLSLAMILSPVANIDSPILSSHTSVRSAYTVSEMTAATYTLDHFDTTISSDWDFASRHTSVLKTSIGIQPSKIISLDSSLLNQHFIQDGRLIIIRDEVTSHTIAVWGSPYNLGYDPGTVLEREGFNLVFNNPEVRMYT